MDEEKEEEKEDVSVRRKLARNSRNETFIRRVLLITIDSSLRGIDYEKLSDDTRFGSWWINRCYSKIWREECL